ncbi:MAG TPA: hypothetical protein VGZ93_04240 [Candidatus Methylacidiphilales bacterium]|jgi:hypothetical protein|nr:hypothetical protein [Candidatus Methylacidiphilales bacterium]
MSSPGVYFWRVVYSVLEFPWLRRLLARRYRSLERTRGSGAARKFLRRTLFALALNRLRNYQGYVPLQAWRAFWEITRAVDSPGQIPRRAPRRREKLRVGLAGMIAYLPFYPRKLFRDPPPGMEIHLIETVRELSADHYLRHTDAASIQNIILDWNDDLPSDGIASQPGYAARIEEAAAGINRLDLDLLLVSEPGREIYDLLDRVDVPAIADLTATSGVCFHPNIDIQFYIHAIKDYIVREDRLFCRSSGRFLARPPFVASYCLLFDTTGYEGAPVPWPERDHVLFFHGRLVKAAQPAFLKMLLDLLDEDTELSLVLYGMDSHKSLEKIRSEAKRRGVEKRIDFRGKFSLARNSEGEIIDPDWHRFVRDLHHAKLAPTSFPMASGCARFETYTAGVPCVNLAIRTDNRRWTSPDETLVDIPALYTPSATVTDPGEYKRIALRLLREQALAEKVIAEQLEVVQRLGSPRCFWEQIPDAYQRWLRQRPA